MRNSRGWMSKDAEKKGMRMSEDAERKRKWSKKLEREAERKRLEEKEKHDREYERIMLEIRQAESEGPSPM
jgi:hypothetical protein